MNRKTRFWIGFLIIVLAYIFPMASMMLMGPESIWMWTIILIGFLFSVYLLYRFTIKKVEPKYPSVPPEGIPDVYTRFVIPRPIHEDFDEMRRKREKLERARKRMSKRKKY